MKFVCNNCGFSAEIPVRRTNCPMCGSSNVTSSAETANKPAPAAENEDGNGKSKVKIAAGPTQRVTLTDVPASGEKSRKTSPKTGRKSRLPLIIAAVVLCAAAAAAAIFFFLK